MEADTTDTLYNFYGWLQTNRKQVTAGAIVVVVIAAVAGLWTWNKTQDDINANQALMSVPALLVPTAPTDAPSAKALLEIAQKYSGTSAAAVAQMLAARSLFLEGKYAEAQQEFSKFITDYPGSPMIPQAKVSIAESLEAQGKTADAMQKYKEINAVYSGSPNIILPVKLTLGRMSEADNKPDQAVNYYKELASIQDPNDPWAAEARERLRLLVAKHPELLPAQPQAPVRSITAPSVMAPSAEEMQLMAPPGTAPTAPAGTNQTPK